MTEVANAERPCLLACYPSELSPLYTAIPHWPMRNTIKQVIRLCLVSLQNHSRGLSPASRRLHIMRCQWGTDVCISFPRSKSPTTGHLWAASTFANPFCVFWQDVQSLLPVYERATPQIWGDSHRSHDGTKYYQTYTPLIACIMTGLQLSTTDSGSTTSLVHCYPIQKLPLIDNEWRSRWKPRRASSVRGAREISETVSARTMTKLVKTVRSLRSVLWLVRGELRTYGLTGCKVQFARFALRLFWAHISPTRCLPGHL